MKQDIDHKPASELLGTSAGQVVIDPRYTITASAIDHWIKLSAPTDGTDLDCGSLSDERGD